MTRRLEWDGLFNARDLGGLPAAGGRTTRLGAVVRSENLDLLPPSGWDQLRRHGVRTVVDLREPGEQEAAPDPAAVGVAVVRVPLDGTGDREFWDVYGPELSCTPLYYRPFLDRMPQRAVAAVAAVADAEPGGVLVHCGGGRDRAGLVALMLLALVGVDPGVIADDHEMSAERSAELHAHHGVPDQEAAVRALLASHGTDWRTAVIDSLAGLDLEGVLLAAGLTPAQLDAVRSRLLD